MNKLFIFVQLFVVCAIISTTNAAGFWDSLVNVDRSDKDNKNVGVHIPLIYWMDLNRNKQGPKLDISVLGGLVKVNVDREKNASGKRPVMVRLLGQKIYNSFPDGVMPANGVLNNYGDNQYQGDESSKEVIAFKPNDYKLEATTTSTNEDTAFSTTNY